MLFGNSRLSLLPKSAPPRSVSGHTFVPVVELRQHISIFRYAQEIACVKCYALLELVAKCKSGTTSSSFNVKSFFVEGFWVERIRLVGF